MDTHILTLPEQYQTYQKHTKNISKDLEPLKISNEIKNKANEIYIRMGPDTTRAKKRKLLLFHCVYNAYRELGINIAPSEIGQMFNLTQGQMTKTTSMFSALQTGYRSPIVIKIISDYIPEYCQQLGLDTDDVMIVVNRIINKQNPELMACVPQTIAIGLIKYYLSINGIELDDKTVLSKVGQRSDTTIESTFQRLCKIDNE